MVRQVSFAVTCKRLGWALFGIGLPLLLFSIFVTPAAAQPPSRSSHSDVAPVFLAQSTPTTTLRVAILSSPLAIIDKTDVSKGPQVFIVQAVVTNTGTTTATDVLVTLDYHDPANGWVLLPGEVPTRTHTALAPGAVSHDYWFASYPLVNNASFQYTVRAQADNAAQVATSDNAYGNPAPNKTVITRQFQRTGNSGITQATADVSVGHAFTVTVDYSWTGGATALGFSPVGNADYDPGAYRLLTTQARLYTSAPSSGGTLLRTVNNRLYITQIGTAQYAQTEYVFIAVAPDQTQLCPYTAVNSGTTLKYDKNYCTGGPNSTIIPFTSTLSTELTKHVSAISVQQGQSLTYTLRFTNSTETAGDMIYSWVWDEPAPSAGSVVTTSLAPTGDDEETTTDRAVWYLGTVSPGFTGIYTFTFRVDGDGVDLADQTTIVNHGFFGINEGSVPPRAAMTATVTSTLQAPIIHLSQSDGLVTTDVGQPFAYTLRITNSGTLTATNLVLTDTLPAYVTPAGPATPPATSSSNGVLVWTALPPLPPGQALTLTIPVQTVVGAPDGRVLTNTFMARYANPAGHVYALKQATDETTVRAPVLQIVKDDVRDPVLRDDPITYTLSYTNAGSLTATNAWISDVVPANTAYMACVGGSTCALNGNTVTWTLGTLPPGASGTVRLTVRAGETFEAVNARYGIRSAETGLIPGVPVTTTVAAEPGHVDVYTFVDLNVNGIRDAGESALAGVAITVPHALSPFAVTDAISRTYPFTVEIYGPMSVTTSLPNAYFRTTPQTVYLFNEFGVTRTLGFGYAPVTVTYAVIYGTVFSDANHNGGWDAGELGLPGVTLTSAEAAPTSTTTGNFGNYILRFPISGSVTLTAATPAGYIATTPEVVSTAAVTDAPGIVNFGYFAGIQVIGQTFADANVNGQWDVGELSLGAVLVTGDGDSTLSDATGVFTLHVTLDSPVLIAASAPAGYVTTAAIPGAGMTLVDASTLHIPAPIAGQTYTGAQFGLAPATDVVTLTGHVWEDASDTGLANGAWDADEPGLPGVRLTLSSGLTCTTDAVGAFILYAPPGQAVTLTAANLPDYVSTNAIAGAGATRYDNDTLLVAAQTGGVILDGHAFGDVRADGVAVITGAVFGDANGDGARGGGEAGLPGVTVALEINGGLTIALITDANGDYRFVVAPGAVVRITAARPAPDYYPTTPESQVLSVPTAGVYAEYNFGYSNVTAPGVTTIYGLVFEDLNADGIQDFGEPGLADAIITLTLDGAPIAVITTTGNGVITGTFSFTVTTPGIYAVLEQNPPGYRSTTADEVPVVITSTLSQSERYVTFGNTPFVMPISIFGLVYEDTNNNGTWDPGEIGLPGVTLTLDDSLTTATNAHGNYNFPVSGAGAHTLVETDPPGYLSTTPNTVTIMTEMGGSYRVDFGDVQPSAVFATVYGTVYEDGNADGVWQPGEPGLAGVLITLNGHAAATDLYGRYTISTTVVGSVDVVQTDLPLYYSTTPNVVPLTLVSGQSYEVNFGDTTPGLALSKTATDENGAPLLPGDVLRYVITVTNASLFTTMHQVWVTDTLPAGVSFVAANPLPDSESPLAWYHDAIGPAETWEITVWVLVDGSVSPIAPNVAQVSSVQQAVQETDPANPPGGGDVDPGLLLSKTATDENGAPLYIGDTVQYVITVTNASTVTAQTGVVVTDTLPAGVTFVSADPVPDRSDPIVWNVGTLEPGGIWTATVRVQVDGSANPIGANVAVVSSDQQTTQETDPALPPAPILRYVLVVQTVGQGSVTIDPEQTSYVYGDVVTLTATVDPGWTFAGWGGDVVGVAGQITVTIVDNTAITATFTQNEYTLTVNVVGSGSVTRDPDQATYHYGDVVTLTATPAAGWDFGGWSGDLTGAANPTQVTMNGNKAVTATFTLKPVIPVSYTLTLATAGDGYGSLTPAIGTHEYVSGTTVLITATAQAGSEFAGWSGDFTGMDNPALVLMDSDKHITATFRLQSVCQPLTAVGIAGPPSGQTDTPYTFTGIVTPTSATPPLTFTWTPAPSSGQSTLAAAYQWATVGVYTLTLRAEHCGGVLTATHSVTIEAPTPPVCEPDAYEEDDTPETARAITVGETQTHNLVDDAVDWITVTVRAGNTYTFATTIEGAFVDTVLSLFDRDGQTLLVENDNAPGVTDLSSRIVWQAPHNGVYYLRVTNQTGFAGCETDYTVHVTVKEINVIYLPLVMRNVK